MKLSKYCIVFIIVPLLISCYPRVLSTDSTASQSTQASQVVISTPSAASRSTQTSQAVISTPSETNRYIGLTYPPIPGSVKTSTSWEAAIAPSSFLQDWSVAVLTDDNDFMLWFSKTVSHDQNGVAYSQVSDVAILPSPEKDHVILVSTCLLKGLLDPEIVVLAKTDEKSLKKRYLPNPNIILAWRANQSMGKLEQIGTKDIECYAETFLIYP